MFTSIITFFSNLFGATEKVASAVQQRDAEKNTATMQANAEAATDQQLRDQAEKAIASGNLDEIRKQSADASQ